MTSPSVAPKPPEPDNRTSAALTAGAPDLGETAWPIPSEIAATVDDPLLGSLIAIARLLGLNAGADTFVAGLPLDGQRLTPALLPRAAERGGLSARVVRRRLSDITAMALPAILLLDERDACVLVSIDPAAGTASIIAPDSGFGEQSVTLDALAERHAGYAAFVRPLYRFEARTEDATVPDRKRWLRDAIGGSWRIYRDVIVASLLINVFALVTPLFSMNVYDRVVPSQALDSLWVLAIGATAVAAFDLLIRSLRGWFVDVAGKRIDLTLSTQIFERVLGLKMDARPKSVGSFVSGLTEFESIREFLTSATITTLIDLPFVLLFVAAMFWIGGSLGWVGVAAIPVVLGVSLALQGAISRTVKTTMRLSAQRQATLVESLVGLETIKITGAQGVIQRRWEQVVTQIGKLSLRSRLLSSISVNFAGFAQQFANIAVIVYGVYLIGADSLTTGALIACTILLGRALAPLSQLASLITRYHQSRSALASVDRLMQLPIERPEGRRFVNRPKLEGAIEFRDVAFSYPGQQTPALQGVSFRIEAGERVGIIGKMGSGKTTLEKLILGLHEPSSGAVLVDGIDLRQFDPAALRRDIGHVPQDVMLFYGTVRDNIVMGYPGIDDAAVLRAARISGVDQFVDRSSVGYDMPVGERGEGLSGGQRQAIALARAELLRPPVLLLDEPTSAMDTASEEQFKTRLAPHLKGRTLIVVTHRASVLTLVDRLLVMDHGRIVADGPTTQVLAALAKGKIHAG